MSSKRLYKVYMRFCCNHYINKILKRKEFRYKKVTISEGVKNLLFINMYFQWI